jgi:hypothetical protein
MRTPLKWIVAGSVSGLLAVPLVAQSSKPPSPRGPQYRSSVVETSSMAPDGDSDEAFPTASLKRLADGMYVSELSVPTSRPRHRSAVYNMHKRWFVVVDPQRKTYHAFKLAADADIESDLRIKNHLRTKYGVDWDQNRQNAAQRAQRRPVSFFERGFNAVAAPMLRYAALTPAPRTAGALRPRLPGVPKRSLIHAGGRMQTECMAEASVDITTRDLLGFGVRLTDAVSFATYDDQFYGDGELIDDWSYNDAIPQQPSYLGTYWYVDGGSTNGSTYWDDDIAIADQNAYFYNDDFSLWAYLITGGYVNIPPLRTSVYNYTYADAGIGGAEYTYMASGISGYYGLLGYEVNWEADDACY